MANVAPFAGAWIEIQEGQVLLQGWAVAPFAGAWIEIQGYLVRHQHLLSLPSRERGLKFQKGILVMGYQGRSLRGSVD